MTIAETLIAELEQEAHATRRVLERVPQAKLSWKPHPKSFSLGQLALHVAQTPGMVAALSMNDTIPEPPKFVQAELGPGPGRQPGPGEADSQRFRRCGDAGDLAVAV